MSYPGPLPTLLSETHDGSEPALPPPPPLQSDPWHLTQRTPTTMKDP